MADKPDHFTFYDIQSLTQVPKEEYHFFQIPVGENDRSLSDTNLQLAGSLPREWDFKIDAIEVAIAPNAPALGDAYDATREQLLNSGYFEMTIGSYTALQVAPIGALTSVLSKAQLLPLFPLPRLVIPGRQNFLIRLKWPGGHYKYNSRIGIFLHGELTRP